MMWREEGERVIFGRTIFDRKIRMGTAPQQFMKMINKLKRQPLRDFAPLRETGRIKRGFIIMQRRGGAENT